jgi:cell division protein FtsI/penicillin-binding protein 2
MSDETTNDQALFVGLVLSLHAAGMQQLGKVMNPLSGEVERNLDQAQSTINMMEMLQRRTTGNLSDEEVKLLERMLYELRMNYVDEANRAPENEGTEEPVAGKTGDADKQDEKQ